MKLLEVVLLVRRYHDFYLLLPRCLLKSFGIQERILTLPVRHSLTMDGPTKHLGRVLARLFSKVILPNHIWLKKSTSLRPRLLHHVRYLQIRVSACPSSTHSARHAHSLESIWDDKSPFSVLPRANGSHRTGEHRATPSQSYSTYGNQTHETHVAQPSAQPLNLGGAHSQGVRTLEEIEAEMRQAAFAAQRNQNISPSQHHVQARPNQGRGTPQLQQQQQRYLQQDVATPPRLHPHAQSPRFHQYHQEQQIQLLEQERLRQIEDLRQQERLQLIAQMERERQRERQREREQLLREAQQARYLEIQQQRQLDRRQAQAQAAAAAGRMTPPVAAELQQRRYGHHSPANNYPTQRQEQQAVDAPFQQSMQYLPRDIQMQQRLLAEMAQAEFQRLNILQASAAAIAGGGNNHPLYTTGDIDEEREHQETLRAEAMRKIMEAERMEEKRRRKLEKIRHMVLFTVCAIREK